MQKTIDQIPVRPLYVVLICAVFIICVGIFMAVNNHEIGGVTLPNGEGRSAGDNPPLNGYAVIFVGLVLGAAPAYYLLRKKRRARAADAEENERPS